MRKRIINAIPEGVRTEEERWMDVSATARVEVTSEEKAHPVEAALMLQENGSWRAADPGTQTIRLIFDAPQRLERIAVVFEENQIQRTQEFVLRWSEDGGHSFRDIVRQQWNFSPPNTIDEAEDYQVQLSDVKILELVIVPDISRGTARASLRSLRLS
jgi:hypothetical protein